jgi:hypothetical protein
MTLLEVTHLKKTYTGIFSTQAVQALKPEFPEFITREGQRLTPRIIPSASS